MQVSVSYKSVKSACHVRVSYKIVKSKYPRRSVEKVCQVLSSQIVLQKCEVRVFYNSVKKECRTRLSSKRILKKRVKRERESVLHEYQGRAPYKSVN